MEDNVKYVTCKLCGTKRRILTQHLRDKHNLSRKEYEETYNQPAVCLERQLIQIERNKELNEKLSTDPYYIELMKKVRHENVLKPQVIEAKLVKWNEYLHSELNAERTRQRMLDPYYQNKCTEGKLKSEKFHDQKSKQMSELLTNLHKDKDKEWESKHMKKVFDSSKKKYIDIYNESVEFRSTWELKLHNYLVLHNIEYIYEGLEIKYISTDNKEHKYYPDFYIESLNLVLEVKPKMYTTNKINQIKKQVTLDAGYKFKFVTENELNDLNSFFHNL